MRAIGDVLGRSIWKRTALVLTHGNLSQTPSGTDYGVWQVNRTFCILSGGNHLLIEFRFFIDGFATRRIRCLRNAVPAGFLLRPALPAVIVENSETCPADKAGKRMLPDSSLWVVSEG